MENNIVRDHAHAVELATRAIKTLDTKPLEPFVASMLTDGHRAALSAMAISRDEPNLFEQFIAVSRSAQLLNREECHQLIRDFVEAKRSRAA